MNRAFLWLGLMAAVLLSAVAPMVFGQDVPEIDTYSTVVPLRTTVPAGSAAVRKAIGATVANSSTIPMWTYSVTSPLDGNTYSGKMVGASPYMNGARTTNIPTVVIPLVVVLSDGTRFDPTIANSKCSSWGTPLAQLLASPIFEPHAFTMNGINLGSGQYVDEYQRANFYDANVSETGDSYHTVLNPVTVLPAQTITIPANQGLAYFLSCAPIGILDFASFNSTITNILLPSLTSQGVNASTFPLVVLNNVVMANPGTSLTRNCCLSGYHGAFTSGSSVQTYAVADFDTSRTFSDPDIQPISNQVGGWMDNPLGTNPTPSWGHIGQVTGCQATIEVGYPLNGTPPVLFSQAGIYGVKMPNGQTYFPQELAFFSWFYRQIPSIGAGGLYSNGGLLYQPAGNLCQ